MAYKCLSQERRICLKNNSVRAIGDVKKFIFDFDGVLVYTAESYRQAIRNVVDYYFLEILGLEGEEGKLATFEDIQKFKDTGLFNNDWNLSYSIIAYYLSATIEKLQQKQVYLEFAERFRTVGFSELPRFIDALSEVGAALRSYGISAAELVRMKNDAEKGMESFLAQANLKKQSSFVTALMSVLPAIGDEEIDLVNRLLPYDLSKPDLLKRLFEESYLGQDLFSEFYGVPAVFKFRDSLLEKETLIPSKKTLSVLGDRFGRFAVYSEKPRLQGMYLLKKFGFQEYFDKNLLFFQEDLIEADGSIRGKPDSAFFIELIGNMSLRDGGLAYVGDGVADAMLAKNAQAKSPSEVLFFGVLCSSQNPGRLLSEYVRHGADAIMTDINDIPYLLENLVD